MIVFFCLCVFFVAVLLVGGTYTLVTYKPPTSETTEVIAHKHDTILLKSNLDSFSNLNVSISQCIQRGDDYHDSTIYLINTNDVKLMNVPVQFVSPLLGGYGSTYKAGIHDYLYLLRGSKFQYRVCMGSTTLEEQSATYFLFDGITNYWNYANDQDNGDKYSILSKIVRAGGNNDTICTEIEYTITHNSYYFMMMHTPGNVLYHYNFTLDKVAYDTTNETKLCVVSDYNSCEIPVRGCDFRHVKYDILAYIHPVALENSVITHICLSSTGISTTLKILRILGAISITVGICIGAVLLAYMGIAFLHMRSGNRFAAEKQRLLSHY